MKAKFYIKSIKNCVLIKLYDKISKKNVEFLRIKDRNVCFYYWVCQEETRFLSTRQDLLKMKVTRPMKVFIKDIQYAKKNILNNTL